MVVTLSFFIIGRMCPEEWTNPYPCVEEPEYLINQFTFLNAAWYAAGTLLQQGSEIAPMYVKKLTQRLFNKSHLRYVALQSRFRKKSVYI